MIVCLGDLLLDVLVTRGAGASGETVASDLALRPGGSAANTAAWLAATGSPAGFVGAAGRDAEGDLLVGDLLRRGVACAVSRYAAAPSGLLLLETLPDGRVLPLARRGANDLLTLEDPEQQALLARAGWLHLSAYALYAERSRGPILAAAAAARARGVRVSLDLGAAHLVAAVGAAAYRALLRALAPDVLLANEQEAALLAGDGEPLAALAALSPVAVLKRGPGGCEIQASGSRLAVVAEPGPVVDVTGAGDAFAAGLIAPLLAGEPLELAARRAVALGGRCVGQVGGRPPQRGGDDAR